SAAGNPKWLAIAAKNAERTNPTGIPAAIGFSLSMADIFSSNEPPLPLGRASKNRCSVRGFARSRSSLAAASPWLCTKLARSWMGGRGAARGGAPRREQHAGHPLDALFARLVAVEKEHQLLGVAATQQVQVAGGERGGAQRHRVSDPALMQGNAVEVTFHQD